MSDTTYTIGLDFGTDSVRALLVNTQTGEEVVSAIHTYARWQQGLFCDPSKNQFRQHPLDYVEGIERTITSIVSQVPAGITHNIVGIGVDTTGSTPVAVDKTGTPLALLPAFQDNPNAMFVLWKDHTATREADEINALCARWAVDYSTYSGGIYSSEWFWSKILHVIREDEAVHQVAYSWVEHCDWVPFLLTGGDKVTLMKRSRCAAGHKALWHPSFGGLPPNDFFVALDPLLDGVRDRLYTETLSADNVVGTLSQEWAERLQLSTKVVVAVGAFDAHMGAVGAKIEPYQLTKIMGTSTCDILVVPADQNTPVVKGICGQVVGSVCPGMLGLEAGQSAFGDLYAWYAQLLTWPIRTILAQQPKWKEALGEGGWKEILAQMIPELSKAAEKEPVGASGELALDWINGRRTPDANQYLKGVLAGINLGSTAPKLFRALVEASCFGAKKIVDRFQEENIPIKGIIALGGVAKKSPFIMQMMADVLDRPIKVVQSEQACALGAAIFGAVAAGVYPNTEEAITAMGSAYESYYEPNPVQTPKYAMLYKNYEALCATMEPHIMRNI